MVSCNITSDIARPCKGLGGINKIFLFPYVKYSRSQITIVDQEVTNFPVVPVYEVYSITPNFVETTEMEGGAVAWNQTFSIQIPKTMPTSQVYKFVKQNYRAVYVDWLGNIRILGLWNGLTASITNETGSDMSGFNGYRVEFSGKEDNQAYFFSNFYDILLPTEINNFVFQDGNNFVFQNNNNYIFSE